MGQREENRIQGQAGLALGLVLATCFVTSRT